MSAAIIVILVAGLNMADGYPSGLADAIRASADRLGISPSDLATVISYETGATFDPWKKGPTTQWGEHRGLLQFGEPQRKKYGVTQDMSVADQMRAAERYLTDAGVKPGTGMLDLYSAVNAGRVGLHNRTDANNGGAPGTVADKVANQMFLHRQRANALLGMPGEAAPAAVAAAPGAAPASVPMSLAPGEPVAADDPLMAALQGIPQMVAQQDERRLRSEPIKINYPVPVGIARARAMARAAARGAV